MAFNYLGTTTNSIPIDFTNKNFLTFIWIIGIFLIILICIETYLTNRKRKSKEDIKVETSEKQGKINVMSSNFNIINGLIIIFLSLLCFFLFPLDRFIGIPQTAQTGLQQLGIQTSFTFYSLFSVCSNPTISIVFAQCGLIMFMSFGIFIAIIIGLILLIKGLIKK